MKLIPICYNVEDAIKKKHIAYFVKEEENYIVLYEVVDLYFPHPEAPDDALISVIDTIELKRDFINSNGTLKVFKHNEEMIKEYLSRL